MNRDTHTAPEGRFAAADSPADLAGALKAFFGYPSPRLLAALVVGSIVARGLLGPFDRYDLVAALIPVVGWPFLEWGLHRYVLHLRPVRLFGVTWDFAFAKTHRQHHRQPWRPETTFLPAYVHLVMAPLLIGGALWLLPRPGLAASWMAGLASMALLYEWTHFIVHTRIRPRSRFARRLFHNHRMHHFRNERYWYSFTLPQVDRLFGTGPADDAVPRSETCRTLAYPPRGEFRNDRSRPSSR